MSAKPRFYVASKTKHSDLWRAIRDSGQHIISTWIDEAGEGQTANYRELSERCLREISECDALILYCEPGEHLKGALVEAGAALAFGKEVRCAGESKSLSRVFKTHPKWRTFKNITEAMFANA